MLQLLDQANALFDQTVRDRRWLHQHPGVGFDTQASLEFVSDRLKSIGLTPVPCGKAGIYADIVCASPGKTILLRADLDGLPIREEAEVSFRSPENMHACGHDCHAAMLLSAAQILCGARTKLCGRIRLMFQSAEEIFSGAADMIENGVLKGVDSAVMVHVAAALPIKSGTILVGKSGIGAPSADTFRVCVKGKGCHGAAPENGVDAIAAAAQIALSLTALCARELPSGCGAVLSIGKFTGGTAANVIADAAVLEGTMRTYNEKDRNFLQYRLVDISRAIAAANRAEAETEILSGCPPLQNDPHLVRFLLEQLPRTLGSECVIAATQAGGGSEDFAYISREIPSAMLVLAAGEPDKGFIHPQHHPKVRFDETALPRGVAALCCSAVSFLSES